MPNCKEQITNKVIVKMSNEVDATTLRCLENILREALYPFKVEEECTELSTQMDDNRYMIEIFSANKKLEGCKETSIAQYTRAATSFLETVNKNYKDITKEDVKMYLAVYSRGRKQNTVCNMKKFLSAFFSWVSDEGYIMKNPVKSIKGVKPEEIENAALTNDEEVALRDAAEREGIRVRAIIDVLLSTGLRVSEIRSLNRNDLNMLEGSITFRSAKSYKYRTVFLDVRAKRHLNDYLQTRSDCNEALFATTKKYEDKNGRMEVKRMSNAAFEKITKKIGENAGVRRKCTVHVLRKTFATRLADRGCPLEIIQELLGHTNPATTQKHYIAKNQNRVKKACDKYLYAA